MERRRRPRPGLGTMGGCGGKRLRGVVVVEGVGGCGEFVGESVNKVTGAKAVGT